MRARVIQRRHVRTMVTSVVGFYAALAISVGGLSDLWRSDVHYRAYPLDYDLMLRDWHQAQHVASAFGLASSLALILAAIVPFFVLLSRPRAASCTLEEGAVRVGIQTFRASEITGFSVAPDGHGVSVALGMGENTTFLGVDTMDDARRIATALKKRFPADGELRLTLPRQSMTIVVAVFSAVSVAMAGLVQMFVAVQNQGGDSGALLGLWMGTIPLTLLLAFLFGARMYSPMKLHWGTASQVEPVRALDRSPIERHVRRHEEARLTAPPPAPRVRVDLLARGDDTIGAWLARIDGLERAGGYRGGESAPAELLYETLRDDAAPVDVRLAAARILTKRDGEDRTRVADSVTDADIRARIVAITDEDPEAALAAVGPLFRASD